jgi:glycosyltransferase involved in cell wall biosynthesis
MTGVVEITCRGGTRAVSLADYLTPEAEERAQLDARRWIKALRALDVDGAPMRARFTADGESLWWFTELYLHKEQAVLTVMRTIAAIDALIEREQPSSVQWRTGDPVTEYVAAARAGHYAGAPGSAPAATRLSAAERRVRARAHALRIADGRLGARGSGVRRATVAAFVHRAFVNSADGPAAGERYIGRVLTAIEARLPTGDLETIAVGPRRSFKRRRWWDPLIGRTGEALVSIESIGSAERSARDTTTWTSRHAFLEALEGSDALRTHAVIDGTDCWPVMHAQFVGVVWLQWPWSVRAMDRAATALELIAPRVAVTYAEAGGWGRALAVECRRRGVPLVGVQHGFIYRHWLNYLHEADELTPAPGNPADRGFPRPALTLVFDRYAERHLLEEARFPADAVRVVGSAERDALAAAARRLSADGRIAIRRRLHVADNARVVLCATKYTEAGAVLPALAAAARSLAAERVHLVVKPHPSEDAGVYAAFASPAASIVAAPEPLTDLLAIAEVVVTVNSTVAVDALAVGVPSVTLGQPNNLTPFVEARAMLGADGETAIAREIARLLSDDSLRAELVANGRALVASGVPGEAADNAAAAVLSAANLVPARGARPW